MGLVGGLVGGEADVAVDAEGSLLRRANVFGGELEEGVVDLGDELLHGSLEDLLIGLLAGVEPVAVVVFGQVAEELQAGFGEVRCHVSILTSCDSRGVNLDQDTIVAVATPSGRGGIGVVRLSGPLAASAMRSVMAFDGEFKARVAHFTRLVEPESARLVDEAVVTFFPAPHSYTGEDVLEIAAHGSPVVLQFLMEQALAAGVRLARAGEFTERAFLNGRLDLTQAEAVRDLIDASTMQQARLAAEQLGGALSRRIAPAKEALVRLIAGLEAGIDFAEDDIEVMASSAILATIEGIEPEIKALETSFHSGRILHAGLTLAIVGEPNAGKSSLFNRLLDRDRAIVTARAGTTRDLISEKVSIDGIPVELIDTAGLRLSVDEAELLGIEKARETLATADLVLLVTDASRALSAQEEAIMRSLEGRPHLLVRNKSDLASSLSGGLLTSALTGAGVLELREAIAGKVWRGASAEAGLLTNLRQHEAIVRALHGLETARLAVQGHVPHEMLLLDLYACLRGLDELTGSTSADDVLNLIFSTFCIGKEGYPPPPPGKPKVRRNRELGPDLFTRRIHRLLWNTG